MNKNILLIITGSIAAYKAIDLARAIENKGYNLSVILTEGAKRFITLMTIGSLVKAEIYSDDVFQEKDHTWMAHINLGKYPDLVVVAPASADYIAKISVGLADTLSLSSILATKASIIIAPAMNPDMLINPATQDNLNLLKKRNIIIAGPIFGEVACKDIGYGKYIGNESLLEIIDGLLMKEQKLKGKKAVITLGSTREKIDPVRFIGNFSSGSQGALIAEELLSQGCEVHIISGYRNVALPPKANVINAYSAEQMFEASHNLLPADIYIGCAAVCDFKPKYYSEQKIKKVGQDLTVELEPNPDVIKSVATLLTDRPQMVVGFSLETNNYLENAKKKLAAKSLDLIVLNKAEHLNSDINEFTLITPDNMKELGIVSKAQLAKALVSEIIARFSQEEKMLF